MINSARHILEHLDIGNGVVTGSNRVERRLADLKDCFADKPAYAAACAAENSLLYRVDAVEPGGGDGDLHYGIGTLMPGKVGDEYYMTKGHYHSWREAAEIYIGLSGRGGMLLEDEATGQSRFVEMTPNAVIYVPGHTAHRTMNTGSGKLVYIGIYPARAGHDYGAIASRNFRCKVVETAGGPAMIER